MNIFDRLLDAFSAKELKHRVRAVIAIGFCICIGTGVGGYLFLRSSYEISVVGTGQCTARGPRAIEVQLEKGEISNIRSAVDVTAELLLQKAVAVPARIVEMMPESGIVRIEIPQDADMEFACPTNRFRVKLILADQPLWKFLWGGMN